MLSDEELSRFQSDGYLVVRNVLDPVKCQECLDDHILPAMERLCGLKTTACGVVLSDAAAVRSMATGEDSCDPPVGIMIREGDGRDPLPDATGDWILRNHKLLSVLNQLHGSSGSWQWLHPNNLGWIHARLPTTIGSSSHSLADPYQQHRWHVDGGHFTPHFLTSPEQSVVVLPVLHSIPHGGGNTVVLRKSHVYTAQWLHQQQQDGVDKSYTQDCRPIAQKWPIHLIDEVAPCQAGDVLLLHPFVIHAAGFLTNNDDAQTPPFRISFNLGTQWTRPPQLQNSASWLEHSFQQAVTKDVSPIPIMKR